jgi:hypothetical protein
MSKTKQLKSNNTKDAQWRKLKALVRKQEPGLVEYVIKMGWEKRMKDELFGPTK